MTSRQRVTVEFNHHESDAVDDETTVTLMM